MTEYEKAAIIGFLRSGATYEDIIKIIKVDQDELKLLIIKFNKQLKK